MLGQLGETEKTNKALADGIAYLRRTQLAEGSWYGRWGLNYIYGTWSVVCALNVAGVDHADPMRARKLLARDGAAVLECRHANAEPGTPNREPRTANRT